jgi:glycosyltransferase involved in cell wall biosynthesis
MRIGIDLCFTSASHMGTGSYAEHVALALASHAGDTVVGFTDGKPFSGDLARKVEYRFVNPSSAGKYRPAGSRMLWDSAIAAEQCDIFVAPTALAPVISTCPVVISVHDLLFEHHPAWMAPPLVAYLKSEISRSCRQADRIIAISEFTKRDVVDTYRIDPMKIDVVHQGIHTAFHQAPAKQDVVRTLKNIGILGPYFFTLSNHAPHKNSLFVIDVFADWIKRTGNTTHALVIAGGGPSPQQPVDVPAQLAKRGLGSRAIILGRVQQDHLKALYAGACAFLFASQYEGWGLPPLEAIAMGTPAIVSDRAAIPEAVGGAGIVLPINGTAPWIAAMSTIVTSAVSDSLVQAMRERRQNLLQDRSGALREVLLRAIDQHKPATRSSSVAAQSVAVEHIEVKANTSKISLTGCMIIKNGLRLGYPFVEAIMSVIDHVDDMVVVDGRSDDETWPVLQRMAEKCQKLKVYQEAWPTTSVGGRVIAEATNQALRYCTGTHILYVQADEIHTNTNLVRLRELLQQGFDGAAMPFLHFRSSWWKILANPAYTATVRCIPNGSGVVSVDDGTSFKGPIHQCAPPEMFPDFIFHVGWVYAGNIIQKHKNHAKLYSDHADYQEKARLAAEQEALSKDVQDVSLIDGEYRLLWFRGEHPNIIAHLLKQDFYDYQTGLKLWQEKWRTRAPARLSMAGHAT